MFYSFQFPFWNYFLFRDYLQFLSTNYFQTLSRYDCSNFLKYLKKFLNIFDRYIDMYLGTARYVYIWAWGAVMISVFLLADAEDAFDSEILQFVILADCYT